MPTIEILASGTIDDRDSAYPQVVQLPGGDLLCSFSVGGGPLVRGGSELARSCDGGKTWSAVGTILPPTDDPRSTNALKLSLAADGKTLYAYGTRFFRSEDQKFGEGRREAVLCVSTDEGRTWSDPQQIAMPGDHPLEVSHAVLPLSSGRLLAPAATLPSRDRLGERVFVAISDDGGQTWPRHALVFHDANNTLGFFEQKIAIVAPNRILATAWTVTLGDIKDRPNSFSISNDGGLNWSQFRSTGIHGQTLTPIPAGDDRLLILYNRRYGRQGIIAALATFNEETWSVLHECFLYDAMKKRETPTGERTGLKELETFAFGFPTAIRLRDGTFLATYWCNERGRSECRWARLAAGW